MKIVHYIMFAVLMVLSSCGNKKYADEILQLQSRPIDMSCCKDAVLIENGEETKFCDNDSAYKLIIYIDSTSCSPCFISHMQDYMEVVNAFKSAGVSTLFIFEPTQKRMEEVTIALRQFAYPTKAIVVSNGNFSAHNSHIPSSALLHSFLLNSANAVTIVGNPLRNGKLKELMLNNIE